MSFKIMEVHWCCLHVNYIFSHRSLHVDPICFIPIPLTVFEILLLKLKKNNQNIVEMDNISHASGPITVHPRLSEPLWFIGSKFCSDK